MLKLPAHLRAVDGGKSDAPDTLAEQVKPTAPEKPADLPESVSEAWDEIVAALDEVGVIARCDGPALELALRHFIAARTASDDVADEGPRLWDEKNGRWMKNPASQVFRDHSTAFLEYAKQLGLTFVSRARTPHAKESDDGGSANPYAPAAEA